MNFLHPGLLAAGLACVAIPILIHLLMNRRRKPVRWAAMRFLLEAYRRQQRRLLIEKWLLLATRCLIFALLAAALARPVLGPVFGSAAGGSARTVYVLLDNSLTAQITDRSGEAALDRHKRAARSVLNAVVDARAALGGGGGVRVALITLASPAEGVVVPPSTDVDAVARLIDEVRATDARADLAGALRLASEQSRLERTASSPPPMIVVLSDVREGVLDAADTSGAGGSASAGGLSAAVQAGSFPVGTRVLVSADAVAEFGGAVGDRVNTAVASVEPLRPILFSGGSGRTVAQQVRVLLTRSVEDATRRSEAGGAGATTVRLRLEPVGASADSAGAAPGGSAVVRWSAGQQTAEAVLTVAGEWPEGPAWSGSGVLLRAAIDEDAIGADNVFVRPMEVRQALRVGVISPRRFETRVRADRLDPSQWLRLALTAAGDASSDSAVGGGVDAVEIDPAGVGSARLSSFDALLVPRPDLIADADWARLRLFVEGGGLLMVFPPAEATTHLWPDRLARSLAVPMTAPREAVVVGEPGVAMRAGAVASAAGEASARPSVGEADAAGGPAPGDGAEVGGVGERADGLSGPEGLLRMIAGELPELLRPVRVFRHLPPQPIAPEAEGFRRGVLVSLEDGTPVLWASPIGPGGSDRPGESGVNADGARTGLVIYCSVAMDTEWTNLPARPLMVPLMQELVRQGVGAARPTTTFVAGVFPPPSPMPRRTTELAPIEALRGADARGAGSRSGSGPEGDAAGSGATGLARVGVDPLTGRTTTPMRRAGVWRATDEGGAVTAVVGVNADARASRIGVQSREIIERAIERVLDPADVADPAAASPVVFFTGEAGSGAVGGGATGTVERPDAASAVRSVLGKPVEDGSIAWRLLVAVLALAVVEVVLARAASHASVAGSGSGRGESELAPGVAA